MPDTWLGLRLDVLHFLPHELSGRWEARTEDLGVELSKTEGRDRQGPGSAVEPVGSVR